MNKINPRDEIEFTRAKEGDLVGIKFDGKVSYAVYSGFRDNNDYFLERDSLWGKKVIAEYCSERRNNRFSWEQRVILANGVRYLNENEISEELKEKIKEAENVTWEAWD